MAVGGYQKVWDAAATGPNGTSAVFDAEYYAVCSAVGNVNGATTITVQYSADGANFYDGPTQALAGAGDFRIDCLAGVAKLRLKSSANVTATAFVARNIASAELVVGRTVAVLRFDGVNQELAED